MKNGSFDYPTSTALVTGASRGIGAALARELARRGTKALVLTARTHDDLSALAGDLRREYPAIRVEIIVADLAQPDAPETLKAQTDRLGLTINLLVNNAGFGLYGFFDTSDPRGPRR
jgi:short-subunit dehydrogenase